MNINHYINSAWQALLTSFVIITFVAATFFVAEPRVGQAVDSNAFTIKQTITGEISFLVQPTDVTMSGSINGVTGGTSNGTTTAVVTTNSSTGYTMSIAFTDNGTDNAMVGDAYAGTSIHDYTASSSEPTYGFYTASTSAVFAYTATADNASDVDQSFQDNGAGSCNTSGSSNPLTCWMEPQTTGFQIINRSSAATTGATTTINFRVYVPNSPSPTIETDTYTATATLTALNQ
ncbi:MAG: hypothetical protein H6779_01540 [Candidatus Nomurabacteria bacterium]|nr:MAG: hypothetical protein H6779_01540 [Candidatus Nomurabacteria bacterium]